MNEFRVRGVAFLAREMMVVAEHGKPRWDDFLLRFRVRVPEFPAQVFPITLIPGAEFLRFNDELIAELYPGKPVDVVYWQAGIRSAEFAFSNQLKGLFQPGEAARFLAFTPRVFRNYFDSGELIAATDGSEAFTLRMVGTPKHIYFEAAVMGFANGALRLLQAPRPEPERLRSFSTGHDEVLYRFFAT